MVNSKSKNIKDQSIKDNRFKSLFIPILIEQIFLTLMGNIDTIILSGFSDDAVAASGISGQIVVLGLMLLNIISTGATILLTQVMGKNEEEKTLKIEKSSIFVSIILPLFIAAFFILNSNLLLNLMKTPKEIISMAKIFLEIIALSMIPQSITGVLNSILRINNKAKVTLYITIISNVINIIGALIVIYTPFSMLGKGVLGVSIVTLISRIIGMVITLIIYIKLRFNRVKKLGDLNHSKNASNSFIQVFKRIMALGIPSGLEGIFYNFSQAILTSIIATLGAQMISSRIYAQTIMSLVFSFSIAISMTTQIISGSMIGSGKKDDAQKFIKDTSKKGVLIIIFVSIIVAALSFKLTGILSNNGDITDMVPRLCIIAILLEPLRFLNCNYIAGLTSGGDVKYPVFIGIIVIYLINIPLAILLVRVFNLGLFGIYISSIIDEGLRAYLLRRRWNSGYFKEIDILKDLY